MGTFTSLPGVGRLRASTLAALVGELRPLTASMTVDQLLALNSMAMQSLTELVIPLSVTNTMYEGWANFTWTGAGVTEDVTFAFTFPAGATLFWGGAGPHYSLASGTQADGEWASRFAAASDVSLAYGTSTSPNSAIIRLRLLVGGTTGNLQARAAQANLSANQVTVKLGSSMQLRQAT